MADAETPPLQHTRKLFELGVVVATPATLQALARHGRTPTELLDRHVHRDWGDLCPEDVARAHMSAGRGA